MKTLQILLLALTFSLGYPLPAMSAPTEQIPAQAIQKMTKGPRHHRGMSKAMMKELNLSEKQTTQWNALREKKKAETATLREQIKKLREQEEQINRKYEAEIKKILNDDQAKKYESMLSKRPERPHGKKPHPKNK